MKKILLALCLLMSLAAQSAQADIAVGNGPAINGTSPIFSGNVALAGISAPVTPVLSYTAGGTIAATTYYVKTTYNAALGETLSSTEASLAVPVNSLFVVASPPSIAGATSYNVYAYTASGQEVKQASSIALGSNFTEPTTGIIAGTVFPTVDNSIGRLNIGSSYYGPTSASVNGQITASASITGSSFYTGVSTYGPTSATVNGHINQYASGRFGTKVTLVGGVVTYTFPIAFASTPIITITAEGLFSTSQIYISASSPTFVTLSASNTGDTRVVDMIFIGNPN